MSATRTIYLHAGFSKTGSSALQSFFALNAARLKERYDLSYPLSEQTDKAALGEATNGNIREIVTYLDHRKSGDRREKAYRQRLQELLREGQGDLLFSSEALAQADPKRLKSFREDCMAAGFDFRVIYYVRTYPGLYYSNWLQGVKRSALSSPFGFEEYVLQRPHCSRQREALDLLLETFGQDRVRVRAYDARQFEGGDILLDFFRKGMGLEAFTLEGFELPQGRVNPSLNPLSAKIMLLLNGHFEASPISALRGSVASTMASKTLLEHQGKWDDRQGISRELAQKIEELHAEDIAYIDGLMPEQSFLLTAHDFPSSTEIQEPRLSPTEEMLTHLVAELFRSQVEQDKQIAGLKRQLTERKQESNEPAKKPGFWSKGKD